MAPSINFQGRLHGFDCLQNFRMILLFLVICNNLKIYKVNHKINARQFPMIGAVDIVFELIFLNGIVIHI